MVELEPEPPRPPRPVPIFQPSPSPATTVTVAEQPVSQEFLGRICPYCRFPLKQGERMIVCPACKVGHHADCWRENGGCTTYGCQYSPQAHPVNQPPPVVGAPSVPPAGPQPFPASGPFPLPTPAATVAAARLDADATNALILSILGLFCLGILSLIGVIMGIGVLARMRSIGLNVPAARSKAIGAIIIGLLVMAVMVGLIIVSVMNLQLPTPPLFL